MDQVTEQAINLGYRFDQKLQRWRQGRAVQRGDIPTMLAFDGYGSPRDVRALGRVLLKTRSLVDETGAAAESIRGWRSFSSVPYAFAHVNVWLGDHEFHFVADKGGVIDVDLNVSMAPGVHTIYMQAEGSDVTEATITVVSDQQHLGVVCDVDDTVMVTALPRPLLAAWNSFVAKSTPAPPPRGCPP